MQLYSKSIHVIFRKVILRSSKVDTTISMRDCKTEFDVSKIENRKVYEIIRLY